MIAKVSRSEKANYIEIVTNADGSIGVNELRKHFPKCVGIRYRCKSTGNLRGTHVFDDQFHLPLGVCWSDNVFHCVYEETDQQSQEPDINIEYRLSDKYQLKTFDMIALGLPDNITDESFYRYFSQFGKLTMCELRKNLKKPKSKGYGFLKYGNFDDQNQCIKTEHIIGNTTVCLRLPTAKMDSSTCKRKVFITNITPSVTQEDILEYFSVFGKVVVERVYTKQEMQKLSALKTENSGRNNLSHNNISDNEPNFDEGFIKSLERSDHEMPVDKPNEYQHPFDNSFSQQDNSDQTADQNNYYNSQQYQYKEYNYDQQKCEQPDQNQFTYDAYQSQTVHPDEGCHRPWQSQYLDGQHKQLSYSDYQHHNYYITDSVKSYQITDFNFSTELQQFPTNSHQNPPFENQNFPLNLYENHPIPNYQIQSNSLTNQSFPSQNILHQQYTNGQTSPSQSTIDSLSNQKSGYTDNSFPLVEQLRNANNSDIDSMSLQIMTEIVYRILEQLSLPNEKDVLVKLLVEQLLSTKSNSNSTGENEMNNVEKLIKILQNPNFLDSIIKPPEKKRGDAFNRNK